MNSSGTSTTPSSHIRKRRAHKRSRNGCMTCKQRHIRCDELKPVCTNCLTRGGDCGYPDAGSKSGSGSGPGGGGPADIRTIPRVKQLRLLMFPTSPVDPFDALPVKMPHRSMELFDHFTNYRIFSRTPVPKSQDTACVGIVLGGPGVFRAGLLMAALHFSWMSPTGSLAHSDMEETYLHHKLEAMRHVNELVADPQLCTSDDCIGLIAALAMAESGMGDIAAAEAHLKGLFTLVNMRRPEEWQHRFWGILQRIILVTGSFIAASKKPERGCNEQFMATFNDSNCDEPLSPNLSCPQPTGPVFSTAPFIATRLSPFYMGSTPDLEACKADAEGEVLINALQRLSSLTSTNEEVDEHGGTSPCGFVHDMTSVLLADTDAYIISLLFKPHALYPEAHKTTQVEGLDDNDPTHDHFTGPPPHPANPLVAPTEKLPTSTPHIYPYASLPVDQFPSSSRAWASAAYLYLHVVLEPLWSDSDDCGDGSRTNPSTHHVHQPDRKGIDNPYFLRLLLDTLKADIQHTEQGMRKGTYSKELWIWKVIIGAYTLAIIGENDVWVNTDGFQGPTENIQSRGSDKKPRICPEGARVTEQMVVRLGSRSQFRRSPPVPVPSQAQSSSFNFGQQEQATVTINQEHINRQPNPNTNPSSPRPRSSPSYVSSPSSSSSPVNSQSEDHQSQTYTSRPPRQAQPPVQITESSERNYIPSLQGFLASRMRSWSQATRITSWGGVKENISKIAWPENSIDIEAVTQTLWEDAMRDVGGESH